MIERDGIDTTSAVMREIITKADIQEYCERDPGGETKQYGGKLTIAQCVTSYLKSEGKTRLAARANCRIGFVEYQYGKRSQGRAEFPLVRDADTSCASGMPPLIQQFKMLCPTAAKRLALE